jgi:putative serine protease PepD
MLWTMTEYPGGGDRPEQDQPGWPTPPSGSQPTPEPEQGGSWPFDDRDRGQQAAAPRPSPWSQPGYGEYQQSYSYTPPPQQPPPPYGYSQSEPNRPRRRGALAATAVVVAAVVGGGAGAAIEHHWGDDNTKTVISSLATPPAKNTAAQKAPDGSVQKVAAQLLPSVVSITVSQGNGSGDEGTGIILTSDGEIMTNNHVVAAAAGGQGSISVTFNDGKTVQASILGRDTVTDLAVIKARNVSGAQPAQLGSSGALRVGQSVVALGSPFGLSGTVTTGIVSALNRPVATSDSDGGGGQDPNSSGGSAAQATVIDAIQTDAAINPGNSGGALVNMNGQVVGINQSIASVPGADTSTQSGSIGLGFAIPIDEARPIIAQLVKSGKATHAQIGVKVTTAANSQGVTTGARLVSVESGQAGAKGGLKAGDVITKLDSREIDSDDALIAAVRSHRPGDTVTLTYTRNGTTHTTRVTLGSDS